MNPQRKVLIRRYLANPSRTDHHSKCRTIDLSQGKNEYDWKDCNAGPIPSSENLVKSTKEQTLESLTVSRLGDCKLHLPLLSTFEGSYIYFTALK